MLKKLCYIAVWLLFTTTAYHAQAQSLLVGAKTGLNYSSIALDYFDTYDFRMGWNAGLFVEFQPAGLPLAITAEAHYTEHGADAIDPTLLYFPESPMLDLPIEETNIYFQALEIPLLLKMQLPFLDALSPAFYLGGAYNIIFSAYNENVFIEDQLAEAAIDERVAANDFSALAGLGGAIAMGPFAATYDLRYRMGYNNLNNIVNFPEYTAHSWQFMVGFGYRISFGAGGGTTSGELSY